MLSFVAPILEESAEQLAPYKQASQKFAEDAAAAKAAARAADAAAVAAAANGGAVAGEERAQQAASPAPAGPQVGPAGPPPQQRQEQQEGLVESEGDGSDGEGAVAAGPIGPAAGPIGPAAFPPGTGPTEQLEEGQEAEDEEELAAGARQAAGPAMPPAEWLAAAAQVGAQAVPLALLLSVNQQAVCASASCLATPQPCIQAQPAASSPTLPLLPSLLPTDGVPSERWGGPRCRGGGGLPGGAAATRGG